MLVPYKKDYEKVAMGLLSYLPDFKNLQNLKEEMQLYAEDPANQLYLYRDEDQNIVGLAGCETGAGCLVLRYLSLAPGFRDDEHFFGNHAGTGPGSWQAKSNDGSGIYLFDEILEQ